MARKHTETRPETYRIGAYVFDPTSGDLKHPERETRLAPQPARLLARLVRTPGTVVTRTELSEHLWPDGFVEADLGINQCVREIRQALGDDAKEPRFIETLPRRGYRLIAPVEPIHAARRERRRRWVRRPLGWALAALVGFVLGLMAMFSTGTTVLVLPLESLDPSAEGEQFGIAVQEASTVRLLDEVPGDIPILGSGSVPRFPEGDHRELARDLHATHFVSGTVRIEGSTADVFVQFVRVLDGRHLWASRDTVALDGASDIAEIVARRVAEHLR